MSLLNLAQSVYIPQTGSYEWTAWYLITKSNVGAYGGSQFVLDSVPVSDIFLVSQDQGWVQISSGQQSITAGTYTLAIELQISDDMGMEMHVDSLSLVNTQSSTTCTQTF